MPTCTILATFVGCALLAAPIAAIAADRGPSAPEEGKQAQPRIEEYLGDPLNPYSIDERESLMKWVIEVPDVHVRVCIILDQLPKGNEKYSADIFAEEVHAQTAYVLEHPDEQSGLNT